MLIRKTVGELKVKIYYIQYTTDFHLLAALGAIGDLENVKLFLVGPATKVVERLLLSELSIEFVHADPRGNHVSFSRLLSLLLRSRCRRDITIVSPFVFPFYTFLALLGEGVFVRNILRTDEGVGSYASFSHYYASLKFERPDKPRLSNFSLAVAKKVAVKLTKWLGFCKECYFFSGNGGVDAERINSIQGVLGRLGKLDGLNGRVIYVSQPRVHNFFCGPQAYADFLLAVGRRFPGPLVVKRHPADSFNYEEHGFEVVEGYPLELYEIDKASVFGFSSTALLMAKLLGGCSAVYYISEGGGSEFYLGLSVFNKCLFQRYLLSIEGGLVS